jgi:hypothetical protein
MAKRPESLQHPEVMQRFRHANLYYLMMVVSMVLGILCLVQGVRYHVDDEINFAIGFYTMAVLLLIVAKSSHARGKGHYTYHGHIEP